MVLRDEKQKNKKRKSRVKTRREFHHQIRNRLPFYLRINNYYKNRLILFTNAYC